MTLQDLGALGELVGGLAVVLSLAYVAYQVRQNSRQIEQNSRHLEASMYLASGESFTRWWSLIVQDEDVAELWNSGLAGKEMSSTDKVRFHSLAMILFTAFENNFHQEQLGSHHRGTLKISQSTLSRLLASPGGNAWWARVARQSFTSEFVRAVESLVSVEPPADSDQDAA
jgi:hypothetical protein